MAEQEKEVLVRGKEPVGENLGPNITYLNPDGDVKTVGVLGITFRENEPVNVTEILGKGRAQQLLRKLAGNPHFRVDGGPDHREARGDPERLSQHTAAGALAMAAERQARLTGQEPPEDYDAPLKEVLEGPKRPDLPGRRVGQVPENKPPQARGRRQEDE
jgi:hypothetical protein